MKYIPDSVVLRQSPTTTRGILRSTSRQVQKRKCRDMYQAFRKPAFDAHKIAFFFSLRESDIQALRKRIIHSANAEKKNNNNKTLLFIEAHQLIGILPASICTSPPQSWQPKAFLLPL